MSCQSIEQACQETCLELGVEYISVPSDGKFYSTKLIDGHKRGQARIKLHPDGTGGLIYNWVTGLSKSFFINQFNGVSISDEERAKIQAERQRIQAELITNQNKAAIKAQTIWNQAKPAPPDHPYLVKKGVKSHHTRQIDRWEKWVLDDTNKWKKLTIHNALLIPLFNAEGVVRNIQAIFPTIPPELNRNKDFLPKAELSGLFSWVGVQTETVCIVEGVATGFTVHEETGWRVYIAFSAGQLLAVAKTIRKHLPEAKIILCSDHDKSGIGLEKANEAAQAVNGLVTMPPIEGMDFNDYALYLQGASHDQ